MKYRMLTNEELAPLDDDLKAFLIVNGVHSEEWARINADEPEKAKSIVGSFSDAVLQIVYEKLEFLEFRSAESCMLFRFGKDMLELISVQRKEENSQVDLSTPESIHMALSNHAGELTWFRTSRSYTAERETEIHRMLEGGCVVSSVDFWNAMNAVVD
jgi:hypothetical protein